MSKLHTGQRVRILIPLCCEISQQGTIYDYLPSRPHPWHVRPDGRPQSEPGIAFTAEELKPIEEESEVKP